MLEENKDQSNEEVKSQARAEDEPEPVPLKREGTPNQQDETVTEQEPTPFEKSLTSKEEKHDEAEIAKIREIFNTFVSEGTEGIMRKDVLEILKNLKCNAEEGKARVSKIANDILKAADVNEQIIDFDTFLLILKEAEQRKTTKDSRPEVEHVSSENPPLQSEELVIELDAKVLEFLKYPQCYHRLLEEYRKKSVQEGNYAEAKKAKEKSEELKRQYLYYTPSKVCFVESL